MTEDEEALWIIGMVASTPDPEARRARTAKMTLMGYRCHRCGERVGVVLRPNPQGRAYFSFKVTKPGPGKPTGEDVDHYLRSHFGISEYVGGELSHGRPDREDDAGMVRLDGEARDVVVFPVCRCASWRFTIGQVMADLDAGMKNRVLTPPTR